MHSGKLGERWVPGRLILIAVLFALALSVALVPALLAQEDVAADPPPDVTPETASEVYIITSEEDLEALPAHLRQRFMREGVFGAQDSADLSGSSITVDKSEAVANSLVTYTIVISNGGDVDVPVTMTDALPAQLAYESHVFNLPVGGLQNGGGVSGQTVTWEGVLAANGYMEVEVTARIAAGTAAGTEIANTIQIASEEGTISRTAVVEVAESSFSPVLNLPIILYGERPKTPDITHIVATRPNSQNLWTVSWASVIPAQAYEIQEARAADFSDAVSFIVGPATNKAFNPAASPFNIYYYRVRSRAGAEAGAWSAAVKVIGAYNDEFDNPNTNWAIRRTSHIDNVNGYYEIEPDEGKDWHIVQVEDRWDLGLTSPLMEAPDLPYAIDLEVKDVHPGWQKGLGMVFAGDKQSDICPDTSTVEGWYEHKLCFNEFYEVMMVDRADKKDLQVQRIHEVIWLPGEGGIPVHRKVAKRWYIEKISGVSWDDYNRIRIEVREDGFQVYIGRSGGDLRLQLSVDENMYPTNRYFGAIVTTQEYSNMTARYEYYRAIPLDN